MPIVGTMETGGVNTTAIIEHLEAFLYTPYGLGTLAGTAIILTSLVWLLGCCVFCCCRWCVRRRRDHLALGVAEADADLRYVSTTSSNPGTGHNLRPTEFGTGSSGYQSNAGNLNYSLTSLNDEMVAHSSLDSILHQQ